MRTRRHRPCSDSSPCLASQGLSLSSTCTFSCRAFRASRRAARSACRCDSSFAAACIVRRASSSAGTRSCHCDSCASAAADAAVGLGRTLARRVEARRIDRRQAALLAGHALTPGLGLRQPLVDATRLGGNHLDLLRDARHHVALPAARCLRHAQRRRSRGRDRASARRSARQRRRWPPSPLRSRRRRAHARRALRSPGPPSITLALEVGALARHPLATFGDVADPLLDPAHLERASASMPCAACSASLAS